MADKADHTTPPTRPATQAGISVLLDNGMTCDPVPLESIPVVEAQQPTPPAAASSNSASPESPPIRVSAPGSSTLICDGPSRTGVGSSVVRS